MKNTTKENPPKAARFEISVGINQELWERIKKHTTYSDTDMEQHLKDDLSAAISRYEGYHKLIEGVVEVNLIKLY